MSDAPGRSQASSHRSPLGEGTPVSATASGPRHREILRFIANGLFATGVHFAVLTFNLKVLGFESAGLANLCAAVAGISASFLGNRFFVFAAAEPQPLLTQAIKFSGLYGAIAVLHGAVLWLWSDVWGLDYRLGFLLATGMQVTLSYIGNKLLVFKS